MKLRYCEEAVRPTRQSSSKKMDCFVALLLAMAMSPAIAADMPQPPDAVELMKAEYLDHFKALPPMRKCAPEDAKGAWKEYAVFESAGNAEMTAQKAQGPKYLAFGEYNTLLWQRSLIPANGKATLASTARTGLQYISTAAGMLYVYKNQELQTSQLCFISTAATKTYPAGTLLLARPVEKDKPLTITLYARLP